MRPAGTAPAVRLDAVRRVRVRWRRVAEGKSSRLIAAGGTRQRVFASRVAAPGSGPQAIVCGRESTQGVRSKDVASR